mmetsp:Transcript_72336/g.172758  ORF Transcript_72336/g.172758 Transcript_72336/m.172758 type:complete len:345 (+) Transcript_72336:217-1251(+)
MSPEEVIDAAIVVRGELGAAVVLGLEDQRTAAVGEAGPLGCARAEPAVACPVPAEGDVQHDLLRRCDVLAAVALLHRQVGHGKLAPILRPGLILLQVRWDPILGNVVDSDALVVPCCRDDTWVLGVPVPRSLDLLGSTPQLVLPVVRLAVHGPGAAHVLARHALAQLPTIQHAVPVGVEGDLARLIVGILHDIELTTLRPDVVAVHQPKGRPDRGAVGHVVVLHDHQHAAGRGPRVVGVDHNGGALVGRVGVPARLDLPQADDGAARVIDLNDVLPKSLLLREVLLGAVGVVLRHKGELVEEVPPLRAPGQTVVLRLREAAHRGEIAVVHSCCCLLFHLCQVHW